jgi:putative peptidoglycan lipid II flippase
VANFRFGRATATVGLFTLASRVLGFGRDMLIAAWLGAGPVADAFVVALKLPNLFRRLFTDGGFNAAFIPAYARLRARDPAAATALAAQVVLWTGGALLLLLAAGELAMPVLIRVLAPGFAATPARLHLAVSLSRITFPYLPLIALAGLCGGVLNAGGRFTAAAAAPLLFNLSLILSLLLFRHAFPTPGHALAIGVAGAGVLQLAVLAVACARAGVLPRPAPARLGPDLRSVLRRSVPGMLGTGVTQLNLAIGIALASLLPIGSVTQLYYADRIDQLPLGLIGTAFGTTLLPSLALEAAGGGTSSVSARLNQAILAAALLALPAAAALLVLSHPIVATLFGHDAFQTGDVRRSAAALSIYALGLPAAVLTRLLTPFCFAAHDTTTPFATGAVAVAVNLLAGLILIPRIGVLGPPAAAAAAATVHATGLALVLRRRHWHAEPGHRGILVRIALASAAMALVLIPWVGDARFRLAPRGAGRLVHLAVLVIAGLLVYSGALLLLSVIRVKRGRVLISGLSSVIAPKG